MGFSLRRFFDELQEFFIYESASDSEILTLLEEYIEENRKYAEECGMLK